MDPAIELFHTAFSGSAQRDPRALARFIGDRWGTSNAKARAIVCGLVGRVDGYRIAPSIPWPKLIGGMERAVRDMPEERLAKVVEVVYHEMRQDEVDFFHSLLDPAQAAARARTIELESAPEGFGFQALEDLHPTAQQLAEVLFLLPGHRQRDYQRFVASIAVFGRDSWREPAAEAIRTMLAEPPAIDGGMMPARPPAARRPPVRHRPKQELKSVPASEIGPTAPPAPVLAPEPVPAPPTHAGPAPAPSAEPEPIPLPALELPSVQAPQEPSDQQPSPPSAGESLSVESLLCDALAPSDESNGEHLTHLDRLIIDASVGHAVGQIGSPTTEQLREIARTFSLLSLKRPQSWFHRGFVEALTGQELPVRTGADNDARRAWHLAGWLLGHARRDVDEAPARFEALAEDDQRTLLRHEPAARVVAPTMLDRLAFEGRIDAIVPWVRHYDSDPGWLQFPIEDALHAGDTASALTLLEALEQREALERRDALANDPTATPPLPTWSYLRAEALRAQGRFELALAVAERALAEVRSVHAARLAAVEEAATAETACHGDRVLLAMSRDLVSRLMATTFLSEAHVARAEQVWFSERLTPAAIWTLYGSPLGPWCALLAEATRPHIGLAYLAALVAVCGSEEETDAFQESTARALDSAITQLQRRDLPVYAALLPRCEVLRAMLLALKQDTDAGAALRAIQEVLRYDEQHPPLPGAVVEPLVVRGLGLDIAEVSRLVVPRLHGDFRNLLTDRWLREALANDPIRDAILASMDEWMSEATATDAWELGARMFKSLCELPGRGCVAGGIADSLLALVENTNQYADRLVTLLVDDDRWQKVWTDREDFESVRGVLALRTSSALIRDPAIAGLFDAVYTAAARKNRPEAIALVELMQQLGAAPELLKPLRQAIDRQAPPPKPRRTTSSSRRIRVLFVGGDERQKNELDRIKGLIDGSDPAVTPVFVFPGWGSNWRPALDDVDRRLEHVEIVVMMRYMPTKFGENVRKLINQRRLQWRMSTGHGPHSIADAVVDAARVVRGE